MGNKPIIGVPKAPAQQQHMGGTGIDLLTPNRNNPHYRQHNTIVKTSERHQLKTDHFLRNVDHVYEYRDTDAWDNATTVVPQSGTLESRSVHPAPHLFFTG